MDLMEIRRRMLMSSEKNVIDTSPKIAEYGVHWKNKSETVSDSTGAITVFYSYPPSSTYQNIVHHGTRFYSSVWKNGEPMDYWYVSSGNNVATTRALNPGSTEISVSLSTAMIDSAFCYILETGQILFAGKNSPYYGYTNINDMP